jgi:flagellin
MNNLQSVNNHRNYNIAVGAVSSSSEKLASGYRINRAGDDAAGLAISEKMRAQVRGLEMASKNASDAVNMVNTAEGALQKVHDVLQRARELAVQSASDTNEQVIDRGALQQEFEELKQEVNDIATTTRFNDQNLLDGTFQKYKMSYASTGLDFRSDASTVHPEMTIIVDNAHAGVFFIQGKVNRPVEASVTGGGAASATVASSTALGTMTASAGTAGVNSLHVATVSFAGMKTDAHNGNEYTMQVNGSKGSAMSFQLMDTNGQVVSQAQNVDMTSWSADKVNITFEGVGTFTIEKDTKSSITDDSDGASAVKEILHGKEIVFNTDGADPTETPAVRGSIDIHLGHGPYTGLTWEAEEIVRIYKGDTTANFASLGIQLKFGALTDSEFSSRTVTKFIAGEINVKQTVGQSLVVQAGANKGDEYAINIDAMNTSRLGIAFSDISTRRNASNAIKEVNTALNHVSTQRAALGAMSNRLNFKIESLDISAENPTAAESRIRDVDMAKEMSIFSKKNILVQASTAMLAQANQAPQNVLQLLQ